jgi:hypothetical protein
MEVGANLVVPVIEEVAMITSSGNLSSRENLRRRHEVGEGAGEVAGSLTRTPTSEEGTPVTIAKIACGPRCKAWAAKTERILGLTLRYTTESQECPIAL